MELHFDKPAGRRFATKYSDQWIEDRAAMLSAVTLANQQNIEGPLNIAVRRACTLRTLPAKESSTLACPTTWWKNARRFLVMVAANVLTGKKLRITSMEEQATIRWTGGVVPTIWRAALAMTPMPSMRSLATTPFWTRMTGDIEIRRCGDAAGNCQAIWPRMRCGRTRVASSSFLPACRAKAGVQTCVLPSTCLQPTNRTRNGDGAQLPAGNAWTGALETGNVTTCGFVAHITRGSWKQPQ